MMRDCSYVEPVFLQRYEDRTENMIIMEIDEVLGADVHAVKYIGIGEKVYAIALLNLFVHRDQYDIKCRPLVITQEHLDSMPPPTRSYDHVNQAFLESTPIVMFESVMEDGRYMRFDGRHRIWGAVHNGLKEVPALWCSREVWGCFIIGRKVIKDRPLDRLDDNSIPRWEYLPYSWDNSPARHGFRKFEDDFHLEPTFDLPPVSSTLTYDKYRPEPAIGITQESYDKSKRETLVDGLTRRLRSRFEK